MQYCDSLVTLALVFGLEGRSLGLYSSGLSLGLEGPGLGLGLKILALTTSLLSQHWGASSNQKYSETFFYNPNTAIMLWRCCVYEFMPLPAADESSDAAAAGDAAATPKLQFSHVECLMFAFHQVARRCQTFLTAPENAERLRDFRVRYEPPGPRSSNLRDSTINQRLIALIYVFICC